MAQNVEQYGYDYDQLDFLECNFGTNLIYKYDTDNSNAGILQLKDNPEYIDYLDL